MNKNFKIRNDILLMKIRYYNRIIWFFFIYLNTKNDKMMITIIILKIKPLFILNKNEKDQKE